MPPPFPGMDPYLEANAIWPGFHHKFASELSTELNSLLPTRYYADLEMRQEVGIVEEEGIRQLIVPDIVVVRHPYPPREPDGGGGTAVLTQPRREISRWIEYEIQTDPIRHYFVEIRDSMRGHKLIALIEILSPSNKRTGDDREAYEDKQREVLKSDTSLIELDLLRGGRRILTEPGLEARIQRLDPPPTYLVWVNRSWRRVPRLAAYQIFPVGLRELLPCIPVPLKPDEDDVLLDLQVVFNRAYDTGPYRRGAVDYSAPPPPPALSDEDAAWAAERTRPWRERSPAL
jgi:Protein of unknown function (DUF4058)